MHALFLLTRLASLKALEDDAVRRLEHAFSPFWEKLWKYREPVLPKPLSIIPGDVVDSVDQLLSCNLRVYVQLQ